MNEPVRKKRMLPKGIRTRATIKDAALGLYGRLGWKGITLEEICQASGLTIGAFYFHFESKDALLEEMAAEASSSYHEEIVGNIDWESDFFEISYKIIENYYQSYVRNPLLTRLIYTVIMRRSTAYRAWRENREILRGSLEKAIERARSLAGEVTNGPTAVFTAHWLLSSLEDFVWSVFIAKGNTDLAEVAAGPDVFVRQQATLWYRAVIGTDPSHTLARLASGKARPK